VLYVGRLEPRKGVEHLIEAMRIVSAGQGCVRLVIAGDGPDRGSLAAQVRDARIDAQFAGRISDDQLTAYYQHADVVCAPAVGGESFGIVLLEAMAAGRPVVATTIDGYRELAGSIARLVPPGDPAALANALNVLLADDALRRDLGERGRAFAVGYNWTVIARQLEAIYYDVLNG
jgi:phosphatidyl-myo-inositol alpha-mannosyltransferase